MPENTRLRPRELFFIFLGVGTGAALAVLWFRLVPELMAHKGLGAEALSGLGSVVMHPAFQGAVLVSGAVVLAAGVATRTGSGKDKATWILAAGSVAMFGMLMLSVNALYDPVFLDPDADVGADDDWED
ncbi:hypothetical protein ENSA5_69940 [Enhygromyxa salina]|uniref:Uncharacterized protein n=1 Tax=Enhygromyxa salina TaxID=215803 RepID=A0A2S9XAK9_9BACT|nr:hypothetical protein ENSA5_69940 [Enhygromyxa salina]